MDYRNHDRGVWERIFREAPSSWLSTAPSALMFECSAFLQAHGVTRVLDLGSGFGRWTTFVAREAKCSVVGLDYAIGGSLLALKLGLPLARSSFVAGEITSLPFVDSAFDGLIAILILDNVAMIEGQAAVRELSRVIRPGSPGFVALNPWPMPSGAETDNPTKTCTRCDYPDDQAVEELFSGWKVMSWGRVEHKLRVFKVRI